MAFFLTRPLFAGVLSFTILLAGLIVIPTLPIALYPSITPPTVSVQSTFIGADAESVERSVTAPIERSVNGTDGLDYMLSYSNNSGTSNVSVYFKLGTDPTTDLNNVQQAVSNVIAQLPSQVQQTGVTVQKSSSSIVIAVAMNATSQSVSTVQLASYADNNVAQELKRVPGVGNVQTLGDRLYAMRVWINPRRLQGFGLSTDAVVNAIQAQNASVPAGKIGGPPTSGSQPFELPILVNGRLTNPQDFGNIVVAAQPNGGFTRLRDVARVDLGAQDYSTIARYNGQEGVVLAVQQQATANSLSISNGVRATMERLAKTFPPGMTYHIAFDTSDFVKSSIREVIATLCEAIVLVVIVIFLFLQSIRTTIVPAITIPVSLIGTFALLKVIGFSINSLTLFGLTLATGLVVDDAIVVVENIARYRQEHQLPPLEATKHAMREISGAVVATSLVLMSVFIPVAFLPGTTGQLFRQFALTIAASIAISLFCALTLAPVLSLYLVGGKPTRNRFLGHIQDRIDWLRERYADLVPVLVRMRLLVVVVFAACIALTLFLLKVTPVGFIPDEDQSLLYVLVTAPVGTSIDQTTAKVEQLESVVRAQPEVLDVTSGVGFGFAGNSSNVATMFVRLKPIKERRGLQHSARAVQARLWALFNRNVKGVTSLPVNPPAIQGLGTSSGFNFQLLDLNNVGLSQLNTVGRRIWSQAGVNPQLAQVRIPTPTTGIYLTTTVDRSKASSFGINVGTLFDTLAASTGQTLVNQFDYGARSYYVYVQNEVNYRQRTMDLTRTYVPNAAGNPMPVSQFMSIQRKPGYVSIGHFNLYRSYEIDGQGAQGVSSGTAISIMQKLAKRLPAGMSYDWSGITRQEVQSGPETIIIFALGILFVFLVLVAQFESLTLPFVVILAVPCALLGAVGAIFLRHQVPYSQISSDVYAQIGYVMLVGLAAKNAILIVEFANQLRAQGRDLIPAVTQAAATRLRPILMTSIAFILGIMPLVLATADGAQARRSLGTAVFGGMLVSTIVNLAVVPVFYVIIVSLVERGKRQKPTMPDQLPPVEPVEPPVPTALSPLQ